MGGYSEVAFRPIIGITIDIESPYQKIREEYAEAIINAGGLPVLLPPQDPSLLIGSIDGLIISGGDDLDPTYYHEKSYPSLRITDKRRSDFEFSLIRTFLPTGIPILGICYGMQLINVFFGGNLYQDIKIDLNSEVNHSNDHTIVIRDGSPLGIDDISLTVNSSHHQAVRKLGEGLDIFALSEDGIIEGIYHKSHHFLIGLQWHPERPLMTEGNIEEKEIYDRLSKEIFREMIRKAGDRDRVSQVSQGLQVFLCH